MALPESQTDFNPNQSPFTAPAAQFVYIEHPTIGKIKINAQTHVVMRIPDQPYPQCPAKLPPKLMEVNQPNIHTCGTPIETSRGIWAHRGCEAAVGGGCAIFNRYGRVGPCNVIVEKEGNVDSIPCHAAYSGVSMTGNPTSQSGLLIKGWRILTDRTRIPENVYDPDTKMLKTRYTEVPDLAPFYEAEKVGRFAQPAAKKRGRPKKVADRESLSTA